MTCDQLLSAFGGIEVDLLKEAEAYGMRKKPFALWRLLAAVLTCVVFVIGIVLMSMPTPETYALEYLTHEKVDEETVLLKEGNVWIYYAHDGKLKKEYVKMPLEVSNVFITWRHLSGIGEEVSMLDPNAAKAEGGYERRYVRNDGSSITLLFSGEISAYIGGEDSGVLLESLDKTMCEYLGAEPSKNADAVQTETEAVTEKETETSMPIETDRPTESSAETESSTTLTETETSRPSQTTEPENILPQPQIDESLIGTIGDNGLVSATHVLLSESEMAELYRRAEAAESNKNYQYAYGLYSYLSMQGYKDSGARAWNLTSRTFAMPIVRVHKGAFENFEDYNKSTDYGFMYTDENGTPQFLYCVNENGVWITRTYTPDRYLKGVTSFYASEYCRVVNCIALNRDGSMQVFYDEDRYKNLSSRDADISVVASFFQSTKRALLGEFNVNRLIPEQPQGVAVCVLHTNKKADYWEAVNWANRTIKLDIGDEMLDGLVSVTWGKKYPYGCTTDGRIVGADADIADIKNVRYAYMIDQNYIVSDGHAYYRNGGKGRYYYKKDAVFAASNDCFISSDGRIYNRNNVTKYNAQNVSCVYDLGISKDFLYVISNEGRLLSVELTEGCGKSEFWDTDVIMIEALKQIQLYTE